MNRSFSSFSEASRFARQHAQDIGATIKLEKKGNNWVVLLEAHEREMRKSYLNERERYYRSLSKTELENEWDAREEMDLEPDEESRLREIVRKSKGIEPTHGARWKVCAECLLVGDSCTCGRSWV